MNKYKYTDNLINSLMLNYTNTFEIYGETDGALKLAREYGYGLKSLGVKYQDEIIKDSYINVCYRFYQCKPPIKLNEWCSEIYKMF